MTIKVTVSNTDTRPTAVIKVSSEHATPQAAVEIRGGESRDFTVDSASRYVITEVAQP